MTYRTKARQLFMACFYLLAGFFMLSSYADDVTIDYGGGTYTGEISLGIPHGSGTWTFADGRRFSGGFRRGRLHGHIDAIYSDGSRYRGEFIDGLRHGHGAVTKPDGSTYVGEFNNDKRHGQGVRTYADGSKYLGEYKKGKPWNGTAHDKDGNITATYSEGVRTEK